MFKILLSLCAMIPAFAVAQDLTGTWQGKLNPGRELRIVIKVSKAPAGDLKATLYSIDQSPQGLPASAVTLKDSLVKMTIGGIGATYEGKLSADGKSIAGTFTQGDKPLPLELALTNAASAWAIPEPPPRLAPMAATASPTFEVATIKPSRPDAQGKGFQVRGRNFSTTNTSAGDLISFAYGLHAKQVVGGPAWLETEKYDISGVPDAPGAPSEMQWKIMLQKLLKDRFQFASHREKRELSAYTITTAKGGPKLTKSEGDPNGLPGLMFRGLGLLPAMNASVADLASAFQAAVLDKPVIDQSGIAGRYDFTLKWTPDQFQFPGIGPRPPITPTEEGPDLATAMQQQLGLKLEQGKAVVEVMTVDKVEKPSSN